MISTTVAFASKSLAFSFFSFCISVSIPNQKIGLWGFVVCENIFVVETP